MGRFAGMKGLVLGVANDHSLAWAIAKEILAGGGLVGYSHLPDRPDDERQRNRRRVALLTDPEPNAKFLVPMDVSSDEQIAAVVDRAAQEFGTLDFVVHSIAFAKREELGGNFVDTSWDGFQLAQQVSAWSLIGLVRGAMPLMEGRDAGVVCLSYYGAEKVVQNYNVMGVAKASLEASTRYLASDVGPRGVRVNAISAGPIKTVSAMGVADFGSLLDTMAQKAPLRRNVDQGDVGNAAVFLLSNLARGITGQTIYVDAGYSIMGA
jgi:enoyl-[acyl-carrier protein] reductase I